MGDVQRPRGARLRTIHGDLPSQRPPAPVTSSAPPPSFDAFDEAPTVARAQPALTPPPAAPAHRSDHATLLGVPPPGEASPPVPLTSLDGPAFVGPGSRWDAGARAIRWAPPPAPPPPSLARGALAALAFALAVLAALAAAKSALDASARARAGRHLHTAGAAR